MPSLMKAVLMS